MATVRFYTNNSEEAFMAPGVSAPIPAGWVARITKEDMPEIPDGSLPFGVGAVDQIVQPWETHDESEHIFNPADYSEA